LPFKADLPFLVVVGIGFSIPLFVLHFTQYANNEFIWELVLFEDRGKEIFFSI